MLLYDAELYVRIQNIFNPKNFDPKLRSVAEFIQEHCDKFHTMPERQQISASTGIKLQPIEGLNDGHFDWLLEEFESFTRRQELERAILKSADLLEKGDYDPVEKLIKDAVQISLTKDMGLDYFEDPRTRLNALKDNNGQNSTGWSSLDKVLYGGFNRGELQIFAGGSGSGKSLFMQNLSVNWIEAGLNGVYITLELSEGLTAMRLDGMLTNTSSKHIFKELDNVEMKVKMMAKKSGTLQIKYMNAQSTVNDIRAYVKELSIQSGRQIDFICVDYLDLLMPVSAKVSPNDLFVKDKYVSEELRNLAKELGVLFVTASQLNRCLTLDTQVEVKDKGKLAIQDIAEGDMLLTDSGYNTVVNKFPATKQKVYQIKTKSGETIRCSEEHVFPTGDGEKKISTGLSVGDVLYRRSMHKIFGQVNLVEDEIIEIKEVGYEDTIDIETDGNHLFFANDILTHNSSVDEIEFDHSHISGGISKINTADNVFGIFTSRSMRERGRYQIQLMKTRSSSGVGQKVDLDFDIESLRILDAPEQNSQTNGQSIMSTLASNQGNSTTNIPSSESETESGKINAEVQSTKLKQMLNQIKSQ